MNNLTTFNFDSNAVRIITINEEPWFVLVDVLKAIGTSTSVHVAKTSIFEAFGDEGVSVTPIFDSLAREQMVNIIPEFSLTYLLGQSRTELGKAMNVWLHKEVLPSIRKTGSYHNNEQQERETSKLLNLAGMIAKFIEGRGVKPAMANQIVMSSVAKLSPFASPMLTEVSKAMGIEQADTNTPLTPTGIAQQLTQLLNVPLKAAQINLKLEELGLQSKVKTGNKTSKWVLTPQGEEFGQAIPFSINLPNGKSKNEYQIKWNPDVVTQITNNW